MSDEPVLLGAIPSFCHSREGGNPDFWIIRSSRMMTTRWTGLQRRPIRTARNDWFFIKPVNLTNRRIHIGRDNSKFSLSFRSIVKILPIFSMMTILLLGCSSPVMVGTDEDMFSILDEPIQVGASRKSITPAGPIFMAGSVPYRLSISVHDDLWASAVVVRNSQMSIAFVSLDLIGINYDDVVRIRQVTEGIANVDYILIAATHTHTAPDLIGFWAPSLITIDDFYKKSLRLSVANAIKEAMENSRPAVLTIASKNAGEPMLITDVRDPVLLNDTMTVWRANDLETGDTIATMIHYATHPILAPQLPLQISSDFVHYLREAVEKGAVTEEGNAASWGGICLYFNGDMAGRLFPTHYESFEDIYSDPGYGNAQAYGYRLAIRAQKIYSENFSEISSPIGLGVKSKTISVPIENSFLKAAMEMNVVKRGFSNGRVNSETSRIRIGPMEFFGVPGMIFPELVQGGFGPISGSDFPDASPEQPVIDDLAEGDYVIPVGLANDMLGYIIPKCMWDSSSPFTSSDQIPPYGELVSPGPETARIVLDGFSDE